MCIALSSMLFFATRASEYVSQQVESAKSRDDHLISSRIELY
jgi:hypothetical protein